MRARAPLIRARIHMHIRPTLRAKRLSRIEGSTSARRSSSLAEAVGVLASSPRSTAPPPFSIFPSCDATVDAVPLWLLAEAARDVRSCARVHWRRRRSLNACRSPHEHAHARNNKARTNKGVLRKQDARTDAHTHSRTHPRTHTRMHARSRGRKRHVYPCASCTLHLHRQARRHAGTAPAESGNYTSRHTLAIHAYAALARSAEWGCTSSSAMLCRTMLPSWRGGVVGLCAFAVRAVIILVQSCFSPSGLTTHAPAQQRSARLPSGLARWEEAGLWQTAQRSAGERGGITRCFPVQPAPPPSAGGPRSYPRSRGTLPSASP